MLISLDLERDLSFCLALSMRIGKYVGVVLG